MTDAALEPDDSLPPQLARLPSGRHGLPREFVAANHRDRLLAACVQEVLRRGYSDTTVAHVIKTAAVSRRTFYELFESKEACFIAVYDLLLGHIRERVFTAFESESAWPAQIRAALAEMLGFLAAEPDLARLFFLEPLAAGPPVSQHHREGVASFAVLFAGGQRESGDGESAAETGEAVVAGIASLITRRIAIGQADQLEQLLPAAVEVALTPFLGSAEADRLARG